MSDSTDIRLADGLLAQEVVTFGSAESLGSLLEEATATNRSVVPFGGKRSLGTGHPATADIGLDMNSNTGVISYAPADLTLSVKTGTTWADLQATLAEQGQTLPVDVPHPAQTTVGGVVATGFAGARKFRQGSLRDLLIGCEYVRGDGLVARAGGMVVKNVSGFEIPRFLHGSWGALAVMTSVNLKVMPLARSEATVLQEFGEIETAIQVGLDLAQGGLPLDAIAVVANQQGSTLAVRVTGRQRAVDQMATEIASGATGDSSRLGDSESATWWQSTTDNFAEAEDVVQVAVSAANDVLASLATGLRQSVTGANLLILPGSGSLRIRVTVENDADPGQLLSTLTGVIDAKSGSWVIESAPAALRRDRDVWGQPDSGLATMQSVKRSFDPGQVLNRGRLFV